MKFIFYKVFTFRGFLFIVVPTLVVIILRLLLLKYGFHISDFVNNFYTCSIFLFLLNLIRFIVRITLEKFIVPTYLLYDNPNSNPLGESSANPLGESSANTVGEGDVNSNINPNSNPPQNADQPIYYGNGFTFDGRVYTIDDPTNVRNRGFLDPITMRPFNMSYQPYARNLSNAMAHAVQGLNPAMSMNSSIYGHNVDRFFSEFMKYNYPNRESHQY